MEDKELQEKAAKGGRPVEPLYGDDVEKMVKTALVQSPKTVETLKKALTEVETPGALKAVGPLLKIEDGKKITFNGPDGKPVSMEVSGSRTKVTIAGQGSATQRTQGRANLRRSPMWRMRPSPPRSPASNAYAPPTASRREHFPAAYLIRNTEREGTQSCPADCHSRSPAPTWRSSAP